MGRRAESVVAVIAAALVGLLFTPGCALIHRHRSDLSGRFNPGDQPDKILYERAVNEIQHGRYDVGRLTLQTLLNTYPDSEYLSKAKLAIADSYYNEGAIPRRDGAFPADGKGRSRPDRGQAGRSGA